MHSHECGTLCDALVIGGAAEITKAWLDLVYRSRDVVDHAAYRGESPSDITVAIPTECPLQSPPTRPGSNAPRGAFLRRFLVQ
jgi:hypothetical protein